jgi:sulfur carrier protein
MRGSKGSGGGGQEILVNGEDRVIPDECTVAQLLESIELGVLSGRKVAVALNRNVVPRSNYARTTLAPGDHVEILEAVGGG